VSSSNGKLVESAARGDPDAIAQLLEESAAALRGSLAGAIPPRWQALLAVDDVIQETYIDAFLDIGHFDPHGEGSFLAWLLTLAKRNLLDALRMLDAEKRGRNRRRLVPLGGEDSFLALYEELVYSRSTPSQNVARSEAAAMLRRAIEQLPDSYRTVIQLYDLEGRSAAEVATAMNRTIGAVFMLRGRAHRHLRVAMGTASLYLTDTR
jgi:RNA polymerase sigma-70 factor (ECF subfamily)